MERTSVQYQTYVQILKEELVPAMGCTEPLHWRIVQQRQGKFWECCRSAV